MGWGFFFLSLQKIHQLSFHRLQNFDTSKRQLQNRREAVNFITRSFWGQKWETVPKNDSCWQLGYFCLAGAHQGGKHLSGTPHWSFNPASCLVPHSGTNHMAIRASCPQPSSSPLFPLLFSLLPPSPRKLLLIFQRKVFKGALSASSLGSECYLLKGSPIFWGSTQRTSSRGWKTD